MTYRVYVSDSLYHVAHLQRRWVDVVDDVFRPVETRTADEIIVDLKAKINKLGKEG
jgi:hypothetical protein